MTTSSQLKSRVDDLTTCPICLELFDIPKSLPCLHTFCLKCLEGHFSDKFPGDQAPCPLCREEFGIPPNGLEGLKSNFFVTSLVDARNVSVQSSAITDNEVQCEVCAESGEELSEIRNATVFCVDCKEKLCEQCSRPHRRMKTGPHKVITIGSEDEVELVKTRGSNCDKHQNDEVRLYCFDCKENICLVCSAVEHDQHKRQEISKAAADFTKQIDADYAPLISLKSEVREALVIMGKEFENFIEDIDAECSIVKATGDEIISIVETRVAQLIDEINVVKCETRKTFVTQKEKLEFMLIGLESFSAYCSELKSKGKPCDITRAASDLHNRATELLQTDIIPFKNYVAPSVVFMPADVSTISDLVGDVRTDTYSATRVIRKSLDADTQENFKFATVLDGEIYSLMETKEGEVIRVYDGATYDVTRDVPVPGLVCSNGLIACKRNRCLYIADQCEKDDESASNGAGEDSSTEANNNDNENKDEITSMKGYVHRVPVKGKMTKWLTECRLFDFSVTPQFTVLITYCEMSKLVEYTTHGKQLREINLEAEVVYPSHAIELSNGQFVVGHGIDEDDPLHRVCIVDCNGNVKLSCGAAPGSASVGLLNWPSSLAVDKNEFIYVADCNNKRVLLLSPTLEHVRDVYRSSLLEPCQLYLDIDGRRLFVTTAGIMNPVMILGLLY